MSNLMSPPSYTPANPLSAFDGLDSAGVWTITIRDLAILDEGVLERWSLAISGGETCPGACCESGDPCRIESEFDCMAANGIFTPGVTCDPQACCFENGGCANLEPCACLEDGGMPSGTGAMCAGPTIECPPDTTIECDDSADPSATGTPVVGDDCTLLFQASFSDSVEISDLCPQTGVITRTWSITDANDNTAECTQTITVVDTTPPVITCTEPVVETCRVPDGVPADQVVVFADADDNCTKSSDCCTSGHGAGCETTICEAAVCACDPFCCDVVWDDACASTGFGGGCGAQLLCGTLCEAGSCCVANVVPGCNDEVCEAIVCAEDPFCCDNMWDSVCVSEAIAFCGDLCRDEEVEITDNRPEVFPPTCDGDPTVVTFTATDDCGNSSSCETSVRVIGGMCCPAETETDLKLMVTDLDLRQDTEGPATVKARFDIWNSNEVRFSGTERCITCWDETWISQYLAPHFLLENLQTDKGKARIHSEASQVCPNSTEWPLLGVAIQETQFLGSPHIEMRNAVTLTGVGEQDAVIRYDIISEPDESNLPSGDGLTIQQVPSAGTGLTSRSPILTDDSGSPAAGLADNRASTTGKGSLIVWPVVEVKWNANGQLIQDTIIQLMNDNPTEVKVQFYQVNGDAPLDVVIDPQTNEVLERAHPGWNWSDYQITLTGDESAYWSIASGDPKGTSPFWVLDPGNPNGRPDLDPTNPGGRVLRGFLVGWAVNADGHEIRWNHLSGGVVITRYDGGTAYSYNTWSFRVVSGVAEGSESDGTAGQLLLNGVEYDQAPESLLFDFFAAGTQALSHPSVRGGMRP